MIIIDANVLLSRIMQRYDECLGIDDLIYEIENCPKVKPKQGRWYDEENYIGTGRTMYFCSECGSASYREVPYCWNCGTKMEGK